MMGGGRGMMMGGRMGGPAMGPMGPSGSPESLILVTCRKMRAAMNRCGQPRRSCRRQAGKSPGEFTVVRVARVAAAVPTVPRATTALRIFVLQQGLSRHSWPHSKPRISTGSMNPPRSALRWKQVLPKTENSSRRSST